jgi:peptide/nickel transport system permease protein
MPAFLRLTRASLIDVMASDHVRTARAKGLAPVPVVLRHGLPIAILPVLSLAAVQLGGLLEGAIVVEAVFALDGIGMLVWQSVQRLDFMVIQAIVFWSALVYIVLTLLADLANAALNPRLRIAG